MKGHFKSLIDMSPISALISAWKNKSITAMELSLVKAKSTAGLSSLTPMISLFLEVPCQKQCLKKYAKSWTKPS